MKLDVGFVIFVMILISTLLSMFHSIAWVGLVVVLVWIGFIRWIYVAVNEELKEEQVAKK